MNAVRFASKDIDRCRGFLRRRGLDCTNHGWQGNGLLGSLTYWRGRWHATVSATAKA